MKPNRRTIKYAEALLSVSQKLDCISETGNSLLVIDHLIKNETAFRAFFYTQKIQPLEKIKILKDILGDLLNPVISEFITLIAERNEYQVFMSVVAVYGKIQKESFNLIDVTAYSIDKIDQETISSIVSEIEKSSGKTVELKSEVNKELLGGIKLRIGNTIFDGTIANQLAKMKKVLLQKY